LIHACDLDNSAASPGSKEGKKPGSKKAASKDGEAQNQNLEPGRYKGRFCDVVLTVKHSQYKDVPKDFFVDILYMAGVYDLMTAIAKTEKSWVNHNTG